MDWTIQFGLDDPAAVTVTLSGRAELPDFRRMLDELVEHEGFRPGTPILFDDTALDATEFPNHQIRALGEHFADLGDRLGPSPTAIVVGDQLTFGLARMFEHYASLAPARVRVFSVRDEAVAWLSARP